MSNAVILKLNELGYTTIPEAFYSKVDEWKSWYQGNVKGLGESPDERESADHA